MNGVLGVDHIGIGVRNMDGMKSYYRNVLGFTKVLGEMPEADHRAMHQLLRTTTAVHSAAMLGRDAGGISVALFHSVNPVPRPIRRDFRYGDIGVAKITVAVSDLDGVYRDLGDRVGFCSTPKTATIPGWGDYRFAYGRDPEGNLIEFFSGMDERAENGFAGLRSIGIAVTDLERSMTFYQTSLGFDIVVVASHMAFSGLVDEITGCTRTEVRSCLLANGKGGGMLELFEVLRPRGRSIPFGTQWGDFGYLQVCLYGDDIREMTTECEAHGIEILAAPQIIDDPEHPGAFLYVRDPDGTPVELVVFPKHA